MTKTGRLLLLVLLVQNIVNAQKINTAKLDSFFNTLEERNLAMGSLAISKNGVLQYQRAIGYSYVSKTRKIPANTKTRYRIGSESKMFTAVMIFQLVEEGRLSLSGKLSAYYPGLQNSGNITIGNLLNHSSGLHNYTVDTNFPDWMDKEMTHEQILTIIKNKGADFSPGARSEYCNTNYLLLGYIIEKVTKSGYASALTKRITNKIGLKNTYYGAPIDTAKNESASYKNDHNNWKPEKETNMTIHGGAGSIVSTASDMALFLEALFGGKLVRKASLERMKTIVDGYGMGLFPLDHGTNKAYGHNGRIEEFYSTARYFPTEKLAVVYITNGILYPRTDIVEGILETCFNEPYTLPFSTEIILYGAGLDKYIGKYSSGQLPIVVNCTKANNKLIVETKGTNFELEPIARNYFMHALSGSFFEFFPEKGELEIKETDNVYYLKKQLL